MIEFTFTGCLATKFGGPADDQLEGHPLSSRGLGGYRAHMIHNSTWIAEERQISTAGNDRIPDRLHHIRHYFFVFHDEMFEALATDVRVDQVVGTLSERLHIALNRRIGTAA